MNSRHGIRTVVLEAFGERLRQGILDYPVLSTGQVLVRVVASGVNPLDLKIRAGEAAHARVAPPFVLGIDLAGVVEAVSDDVSRFAVGDHVYGMTGGVGDNPGSLAQLVAVDARLLAIAPTHISLREAAALPLAAISAWEGLVDRAGVTSDHLVLIQGGAGGVGSIAVQLAVARGASVFATGSASSFEVIEALGGSPVDRNEPTAEMVERITDGEGFDIVFDTVGGAALDAAFTAVRRYTGHVVSILGWGTHSLAALSFRGATYSGVFTLLPLLTGEGREHHGEILAEVSGLVDVGAITPRIVQERFDLSQVEDAHEAASHGKGKVIIDVEEEPT